MTENRVVEKADRKRVAAKLLRESQMHRNLTITPGQRKAITDNLRPAKNRPRSGQQDR